MRLSKVATLVLVVGVTSFMQLSLARAASDCSALITLADWGENSTGYIDIASGGSCLFPIRMRGSVGGSEISQKPVHGKLKKLNISTLRIYGEGSIQGKRHLCHQSYGSRADGFRHVRNYYKRDDQIIPRVRSTLVFHLKRNDRRPTGPTFIAPVRVTTASLIQPPCKAAHNDAGKPRGHDAVPSAPCYLSAPDRPIFIQRRFGRRQTSAVCIGGLP